MEETPTLIPSSRPDAGFGTRNQATSKPNEDEEEDGLTRYNKKLHEKGPVEPKRIYNRYDEELYGPALRRRAVNPKDTVRKADEEDEEKE